MFRHTRLTELADRGLGEFQMKVLAGWTANSRQAATYVHLSGRSGVAPILEMEGVEVPPEAQPRPSPIKNRTCPRCEVENEGDALYCMRCGLALDARARKNHGYIPQNDSIPVKGLHYIASKHLGYNAKNGELLPRTIYREVLKIVEDRY